MLLPFFQFFQVDMPNYVVRISTNLNAFILGTLTTVTAVLIGWHNDSKINFQEVVMLSMLLLVRRGPTVCFDTIRDF